MTGPFAAEYRQTIELQIKVVAAGVVRASSQQVQALLFLNQYVKEAGQDTTFTPYRALVTSCTPTTAGWSPPSTPSRPRGRWTLSVGPTSFCQTRTRSSIHT